MGLAGGDGDGVVGGADEKAAALVDADGRAFQSSGAGGILDAHRATGKDSEEMQKAIDMLSEVKESIINAYEIKTGLSRAKLSHLMDAETWMNANKAVELGFADDLLFKADGESAAAEDSFVFSRRAVTNSLMSKVKSHHTPSELAKPAGTPISELEKRLALIKP